MAALDPVQLTYNVDNCTMASCTLSHLLGCDVVMICTESFLFLCLIRCYNNTCACWLHLIVFFFPGGVTVEIITYKLSTVYEVEPASNVFLWNCILLLLNENVL